MLSLNLAKGAAAACAFAAMTVSMAIQRGPPEKAGGAENAAEAAYRKAITYRALGIEAPELLLEQMRAMPQGIMGSEGKDLTYRSRAWSIFYRGSLTKMGRVGSASPVILYYNPVLDTALVVGCASQPSTPSSVCRISCAFPGEVLVNDRHLQRRPAWVGEKDALRALVRSANSRLLSFVQRHPANDINSAEWKNEYCSPRFQKIAELRLLDAMTSLSLVETATISSKLTSSTSEFSSVKGEMFRLAFMKSLDQYSLSAAVLAQDGRAVVFFTPKLNGWNQVALSFDGSPARATESAVLHLLRFSSEQQK